MIENGAKKVYAFEIDKIDIACMEKTFSKIEIYNNIKIIPYGISDKPTRLYYLPNPNNPAAGIISSNPIQSGGAYEVTVVSIDSWCQETGVKPDFIKMDIEGAEPQAINGCKEVIRNYRPKLAISIYHRVNQRLEIPLQIQALCPDYNFYLKKVRPDCDLVLFAIPKA